MSDNELKNKVLEFFTEISKIPRGSGNEKEISDYMVKWAKERKLEVIQDDTLNIIIRKPASIGYENSPGVILQGHMDMVCESNKGTVHDFLKDPIKLRFEEDMVFATGTTLGADNGLGIAYAMAILADKSLKHPSLEVLMTVEEETTMKGAFAIDGALLENRILLNLDSEEEGEFLVSSAGGTRCVLEYNFDRADIKGLETYKVFVGGLYGGHSGAEIEKGRANAIKLLARVLSEIRNFSAVRICDINGGMKSNAIPREAEAVIAIKSGNEDKLKETVKGMEIAFKNEFFKNDNEVTVDIERIGKIEDGMSSKDTKGLINTLLISPNGIQTMSGSIEGLVESSTNLGVIRIEGNHVRMENEVRSSIGSLKHEIRERFLVLADMTGCDFKIESDYPQWEYKQDSLIRNIFISTYKEMYGTEPKIKAIHAGLECGVLSGKLKGLDCISIGPNQYDVHSPKEHYSISSSDRVYSFLIKALENLK